MRRTWLTMALIAVAFVALSVLVPQPAAACQKCADAKFNPDFCFPAGQGEAGMTICTNGDWGCHLDGAACTGGSGGGGGGGGTGGGGGGACSGSGFCPAECFSCGGGGGGIKY